MKNKSPQEGNWEANPETGHNVRIDFFKGGEAY